MHYGSRHAHIEDLKKNVNTDSQMIETFSHFSSEVQQTVSQICFNQSLLNKRIR